MAARIQRTLGASLALGLFSVSCSSSGGPDDAAADVPSPSSQPSTTVETEREQCADLLSQVSTALANEPLAHDLQDLIGQRSPLYTDLRQIAVDATSIRVREGLDAANASLYDNSLVQCDREEVRAAVLAPFPTLPFQELRATDPDLASCATEFADVLIANLDFNYLNRDDTFEQFGQGLRDTYGIESPLYRPLFEIGVESMSERLNEGSDAWIVFIQNETAAFCSEQLGTGQTGGPAAGESTPPSTAPPSTVPVVETSADPTSRIDRPLVVTALAVGPVALGESADRSIELLDFGPEVPGFGPQPTGDCLTDDSNVRWPNAGLTVRIGPDSKVFGYTARSEEMMNQGPVSGWAIDIAGTGLGWGSNLDAVLAEFPDAVVDPLVGSVTVAIDGALLFLDFGGGGLSVVRAGDFCSAGGVVTVGD